MIELMLISGGNLAQRSNRTTCLGKHMWLKLQGLRSRSCRRVTVRRAWDQATTPRRFDEQIGMAGCWVTRVAVRLVVLRLKLPKEMT